MKVNVSIHKRNGAGRSKARNVCLSLPRGALCGYVREGRGEEVNGTRSAGGRMEEEAN